MTKRDEVNTWVRSQEWYKPTKKEIKPKDLYTPEGLEEYKRLTGFEYEEIHSESKEIKSVAEIIKQNEL